MEERISLRSSHLSSHSQHHHSNTAPLLVVKIQHNDWLEARMLADVYMMVNWHPLESVNSTLYYHPECDTSPRLSPSISSWRELLSSWQLCMLPWYHESPSGLHLTSLGRWKTWDPLYRGMLNENCSSKLIGCERNVHFWDYWGVRRLDTSTGVCRWCTAMRPG
jgi:hypothetical protein